MTSVEAWQNFAARVGNQTYNIVRAAEKKLGSNFSKEQLVAIALLARTATNLRGVLVLLRSKLIVEARTLARSCFENQFWAVALAEDGEKFAQKMIDDDTMRKRQRGQAMFESQLKLETEVKDKLRRWMNENKPVLGAGLLPKEVAGMGAARQTYIFYSILSCDAHPSIDTLDRYFGKDENGQLSHILMEPEVADDEIADTLSLASLAVLGLCSAIDDIFGGTDGFEGLAKMGEEYKALTKTKGAIPVTPSAPPTSADDADC